MSVRIAHEKVAGVHEKFIWAFETVTVFGEMREPY